MSSADIPSRSTCSGTACCASPASPPCPRRAGASSTGRRGCLRDAVRRIARRLPGRPRELLLTERRSREGARVPGAGRGARRVSGRAAAGRRSVGARGEGGGAARGSERRRPHPGANRRAEPRHGIARAARADLRHPRQPARAGGRARGDRAGRRRRDPLPRRRRGRAAAGGDARPRARARMPGRARQLGRVLHPRLSRRTSPRSGGSSSRWASGGPGICPLSTARSSRRSRRS